MSDKTDAQNTLIHYIQQASQQTYGVHWDRVHTVEVCEIVNNIVSAAVTEALDALKAEIATLDPAALLAWRDRIQLAIARQNLADELLQRTTENLIDEMGQ